MAAVALELVWELLGELQQMVVVLMQLVLQTEVAVDLVQQITLQLLDIMVVQVL
jgi:hypothetical protein